MAKSSEHEHPVKAFGWAARDSSGHLSPFDFFRRSTGEKDLTLRVLYCGICHYDLHQTKNEWGVAEYPMVPGHEIVGEVIEAGSFVTRFKVGDKVGVGCMVGSCGSCGNCAQDLENYCPKMIRTFNSKDRDGTTTYGGFSDVLTVDEHFVVAIPDNLPLAGVAPLLCIGITVYSPLKHYGLDKPGLHLGVVGLGGLGHAAVKFAKAMGLTVTIISTSPSKREDALGHLGADSFLLSRDPEQMQSAAGTMDGIINTAVGIQDIVPLISLLKSDGKLVVVAAPDKAVELPLALLLLERKMVGGSLIGGMKETQEMIDFASRHNLTSDVEVIPMDYVNVANQRLVRGDVRYRFVVDIRNTLKSK